MGYYNYQKDWEEIYLPMANGDLKQFGYEIKVETDDDGYISVVIFRDGKEDDIWSENLREEEVCDIINEAWAHIRAKIRKESDDEQRKAEEYRRHLHDWVYFTFNYDYVESIIKWICERAGRKGLEQHLLGKFNHIYDIVGAHAVMGVFYTELDSTLQPALADYVREVYAKESGAPSEKKISADTAWDIYNFINRYKNGDFGEISLQQALDTYFVTHN